MRNSPWAHSTSQLRKHRLFRLTSFHFSFVFIIIMKQGFLTKKGWKTKSKTSMSEFIAPQIS